LIKIQKSLELLKHIFNQEITKEFISICESIAKKNPNYINNGLGVNFSENGIESIKLYYGFHHQLTANEVGKLHIFGNPNTFYNIERLLTKSEYEWHPYYPTGVSFALKIDKNMNASIGHFMMPKIMSNDLFFSLPKIVGYYKNNNTLPILNRKGIFTLINQNGEEHYKDYFYVRDINLKQKIGDDFGVNTAIVPSIEWVIGKGFYSGSSSNDEKIVLQSNYEEVYNEIVKKETNNLIKTFNSQMLQNFNAYCVCPGFYKNKNIKSYYYFNGKISNPFIINTISNIQLKLNSI